MRKEVNFTVKFLLKDSDTVIIDREICFAATFKSLISWIVIKNLSLLKIQMCLGQLTQFWQLLPHALVDQSRSLDSSVKKLIILTLSLELVLE